MAELAGKHGVVFVDLFAPSQQLYEASRPSADDQRHPSERRGLPAARPDARRGPLRPAAGVDQGRHEGPLRRGPGEEPPVLLRLSRRQRLLHLRRPQGPVRHRQLPGRVRQAPQDDPEPRAAHLGHRPGQERPGDDRRQQHRRVRQGRDQLQAADPHHDARRGAEDLHAPRGLRDQPVRLGGRVSRPGRPGLDDLRRQGPALGHDDAVVSDVSARARSPTTRSDPRRRQRRRQGRPLHGLRRRLARAHRHRAGRRRRLRLADAQPDVPQGHQRRRSRRHPRADHARLRHRRFPPRDARLHLGPRRGPALAGGDLPLHPGRDAVRSAAVQRGGHLPLGAEDAGSSTSSSRTGSPIPGATTSTAGARTSSPTPPAGPTTSARRSRARSSIRRSTAA